MRHLFHATTVALSLACIVAPPPAMAYDPGFMLRLADGPSHGTPPVCEFCDISGADLSNRHMDLTNADLQHAIFFKANLRGVILRGAHLQEADLNNADLTGADLSGADLRGAQLSQTIWTDGHTCAWGSVGVCK